MQRRVTHIEPGSGPSRRGRALGLIVAAGLLPCGGAAAQSLDAAQAAAFAQSYVLRSDGARQDGAEARLRGSLDAFMPSVSFLVSQPLDSKVKYHPDIPYATYGPDTTPRRESPQSGISVSLPLFDGFQRWNGMLSARTLADAGRFLSLDVRQQLLFDTASAYLSVIRDRRVLAQRQRQLASILAIRKGVAFQVAVNDATLTDAALADSRVADAQAGIDQANSDLRASELEFVRLTGHPPDRLAAPRLPPLPRTESDLADGVRAHNPRLSAARLDARSAGYVAEAARGALLPQLSLEFTHGRQTDVTGTLRSIRDTTTKVLAKIPIYEPGAIPRIAETAAFAQQKWYDAEDAVRQTVTAARTAFQRRAALQAQVASLAVRVGALRAAVRGYEIERGAGFRTVLDELNSRSELAQAEILITNGETERDRLAFLIAALTGSLGGPAPSSAPSSAGPIAIRPGPPDPLATGSVAVTLPRAKAPPSAKAAARPRPARVSAPALRLGDRA